jgi:hypothetical protein
LLQFSKNEEYTHKTWKLCGLVYVLNFSNYVVLGFSLCWKLRLSVLILVTILCLFSCASNLFSYNALFWYSLWQWPVFLSGDL